MGTGELRYELVEGWAKLPESSLCIDVTDVGADSQGRVFLFVRGEPCVIVLGADGSFLDSWGTLETFKRPHALTVGPDDSIWLTDSGNHTVRQYTATGQLLLELTASHPSPALSNKPFNQCTHVAVDPRHGHIYVSDGYSNAAVHKYTPNGDYQLSWGSPGCAPGQFCVPHNISADREGLVYVADRHNGRVQVFDDSGAVQDIWQGASLPNALHIDTRAPEQLAYLQELSPMTFLNERAYGMAEWSSMTGLGHKITIRGLDGTVRATLCDNGVGTKPGQLVGPHGISVDPEGSVFVGELAYGATASPKDGTTMLESVHKYRRVTDGLVADAGA